MADMYDSKDMTAHEKAAILFIAIGGEYAAKLFEHMDDDEIESITLEIANNKQVSAEQKAQVISEFYQMAMARDYISTGGLEYAQNVLEKALGADKAMDILNRLTTSLQVRPFDFLRKTDPSQLLNFIQNEHPQTIALVMAYLEPDQAAIIMSGLAPESQADVAKRIAMMDRTSPDVIREVERVLERKLSSMMTQDFTTAGGIPAVVEVLNRVDRTTEKAIIGRNQETYVCLRGYCYAGRQKFADGFARRGHKGLVTCNEGDTAGSFRKNLQEYVQACGRYVA